MWSRRYDIYHYCLLVGHDFHEPQSLDVGHQLHTFYCDNLRWSLNGQCLLGPWWLAMGLWHLGYHHARGHCTNCYHDVLERPQGQEGGPLCQRRFWQDHMAIDQPLLLGIRWLVKITKTLFVDIFANRPSSHWCNPNHCRFRSVVASHDPCWRIRKGMANRPYHRHDCCWWCPPYRLRSL